MKSIEQPGGILDAKERFRLHNAMQGALMTKRYGFKPETTLKLEWIENNGKAFRELVEGDPGLLDEFRNSPDAAIARAEEILYGKEQKDAGRFSRR